MLNNDVFIFGNAVRRSCSSGRRLPRRSCTTHDRRYPTSSQASLRHTWALLRAFLPHQTVDSRHAWSEQITASSAPEAVS
jgi:hypothetical protein